MAPHSEPECRRSLSRQQPHSRGRAAGLRHTMRIATVNSPAAATGHACRAFAKRSLRPHSVQSVRSRGLHRWCPSAANSRSLRPASTQPRFGRHRQQCHHRHRPQKVGLLGAPFLFRDTQDARPALDGAIGVELMDRLRGRNVDSLAWAENGIRHIIANTPMRQPCASAALRRRKIPSPPSFQRISRRCRPASASRGTSTVPRCLLSRPTWWRFSIRRSAPHSRRQHEPSWIRRAKRAP